MPLANWVLSFGTESMDLFRSNGNVGSIFLETDNHLMSYCVLKDDTYPYWNSYSRNLHKHAMCKSENIATLERHRWKGNVGKTTLESFAPKQDQTLKYFKKKPTLTISSANVFFWECLSFVQSLGAQPQKLHFSFIAGRRTGIFEALVEAWGFPRTMDRGATPSAPPASHTST